MEQTHSEGPVLRMVRHLVPREIDERADRLAQKLNAYGFDAWGFHADTARVTATLGGWLHRYYFRTKVFDIERVPDDGRVMLIANHSGQLPIDGLLVALSMFLDHDPPRLVRSMVEHWAPTLPLVGNFFTRCGQFTGLPENAVSMLERDEVVLVFPEGARGSGSLYRDRYRLQRFGTGFLRIALQTGTPIVPVAVIGGEEQAPSFSQLRPLARLLGVPYVPLTPTFPALGPLGLFPYPVRYRLHFGEPIFFGDGDPDEDDETLQGRIDEVRSRLEALMAEGLKRRRHVFW